MFTAAALATVSTACFGNSGNATAAKPTTAAVLTPVAEAPVSTAAAVASVSTAAAISAVSKTVSMVKAKTVASLRLAADDRCH